MQPSPPKKERKVKKRKWGLGERWAGGKVRSQEGKGDVQTGSPSFARCLRGYQQTLQVDQPDVPVLYLASTYTLASGWLACLKDKELSPMAGKAVLAALRGDTDAVVPATVPPGVGCPCRVVRADAVPHK